jgi:putative endonuclease
MFYVYVLQSVKTLRFYTGSCQNIANRLDEHNTGQNKSTRTGIPWHIIHTESFLTRSEAISKERIIKNRGASRYLTDIGKAPTG